MAVGVQKAWSVTAADNDDADTNINFAEGQTPASLNNSNRAEMAAVKGWANQISAAKTTGGSANAQTLTSDSVAAISTAYAAGMIFCVKAGYTNSTTTPTFNVDGVGAKTIKKGGAQAALAASDIVAGGIYWLAYEASGDCFLLLNPESGPVSAQPLDATLTALAALSYTSGTRYLTMTGADTFALADDATLIKTTGTQTIGGAKTFSSDITHQKTTPLHKWISDGGGTNAKRWRMYFSATQLVLETLSDDELSAGSILSVTRSGTTVTAISLSATDITLAGAVAATTLRGRPVRSAESSGTLSAASANRIVVVSAGVTINDGVFTADDIVMIYNNSASAITITQDTGMTLRLHGTATTGNRTLAPRGMAALYFNTNAEAIVSGDVT